MINLRKIEQIARLIHKLIPKEICEFNNNLEKKIYQMIQVKIAHLNLISREEFDVQAQVLLRTREKLALLKYRLNELESNSTNMKVAPKLTETTRQK